MAALVLLPFFAATALPAAPPTPAPIAAPVLPPMTCLPITLPRAPPRPPPIAVVPSPASAPWVNRKPSARVARVLRMLLNLKGKKTTHCEGGWQGGQIQPMPDPY
ncbi:hypothetical protein D3C76_1277720 [compost metagenome]